MCVNYDTYVHSTYSLEYDINCHSLYTVLANIPNEHNARDSLRIEVLTKT